MWSTYIEWKKQASLHRWDSGHCIVCNTDHPIHIHKFIPPEVWKEFYVEINATNITAVLYSNGDRTIWPSPFSWNSFHIHPKVNQMWPACYSCWFIWRNSITCTHCNVISLEHGSIPWQAKITENQCPCHFFSPLMTIIYNHWNLFKKVWTGGWTIWKFSKNNQTWTVDVLWGW